MGDFKPVLAARDFSAQFLTLDSLIIGIAAVGHAFDLYGEVDQFSLY